MGRTGKLFAYEHEGIEPDLMTLAKSLAGGVPIGALLIKKGIGETFVPGDHASTFGGNPLATYAGVVALTAILEEGMLTNCQEVGAYFVSKLEKLKNEFPFVKEVRGRGLILGMELKMEGSFVVNKRCCREGFSSIARWETCCVLLPPLIVTKEEVDRVIENLEEVFFVSSELGVLNPKTPNSELRTPNSKLFPEETMPLDFDLNDEQQMLSFCSKGNP